MHINVHGALLLVIVNNTGQMINLVFYNYLISRHVQFQEVGQDLHLC